MEYRRLGRTGLRVSELCLGTMQFGWTTDPATSFNILSASYDAGINFIDTADVYSRWAEGNPGGVAEQIIGQWIMKSKVPRDKLIIATKVRGRMGDGPNDDGLSRAHILNAVEASLLRLGTDYIDLYQTHSFDENTPIEETLSTLDDLLHAGKVRYIGCSNYPSWRLVEALWTSEYHKYVRYESLQPHYNLVHREEFESELAHICNKYQFGVIPYSPLASGFLTGKYQQGGNMPESKRADGVGNRYFNEPGWRILDSVKKIALDNGKSISQVSLAWLLSNALITSPIIGPRTLDQLSDNLGAVGFRLAHDAKSQLDESSNWKA